MIQYLSIKRPNLKKKDSTLRKDLPYQLRNISELNDNSIPVMDKYIILLEQAILARSFLDVVPDHSVVKTYIHKLESTIPLVLPTQINSMDKSLYLSYVQTLKGVLNGDKAAMFDSIKILGDSEHFNTDAKMLPKAFYTPYLSLAGNRVNDKTEDYISPALVLPSVQKVNGGIALVFSVETFTKCQLNKPLPFNQLTPMLAMIFKMDWSSRYTEQFVDVMSRYGSVGQNKFDQDRNIPGMIFSALAGKTHNTNLIKSQVVRFQQYLQYICKNNNNLIGSYESLYTLCNNLGYVGIEFLIKQNPTTGELAAFEKYQELTFLKTAKLQSAMEAAGDTEESDPDSNEPVDDLEDDPETSTDEPEETDDTSTEDTDDLDDFGTDDEDTDTDAGSTDEGTSTTNEESTETDTLPETEDPFGVNFEIVMSEKPSEHFQREAIVRMLQKLINSPTTTMSSSTIHFLKTWVNQWVNLVSVDTTRAILAQLSISIDV